MDPISLLKDVIRFGQAIKKNADQMVENDKDAVLLACTITESIGTLQTLLEDPRFGMLKEELMKERTGDPKTSSYLNQLYKYAKESSEIMQACSLKSLGGKGDNFLHAQDRKSRIDKCNSSYTRAYLNIQQVIEVMKLKNVASLLEYAEQGASKADVGAVGA